ncbi:11933_t:CDS:2 [Racocetra fulgida]|uniref:11933_t:CDS:1 n=1 Tax=Racocetra fulgida TaxID=60492 RepID=A0A9N9BA11_9GLOM|nr:11933_t:CDS:2 [Racocetra fulgida]
MSSDKLLLNFSNKIGKLLEDPDYEFNTIIRTGNDSNIKCFKAHSLILRVMSPYFRTALSSKHVMKEGDWTYLEQQNFSPSTFDVILKFMYTGTISIEKRDNAEIVDLLETAQELGLHELVDFLEDHLIQNREKIIQNDTNLVQTVDHVNAGPGDPNLLTRAAFQAIHEADIILSDKLVPEEVLKLIPSQTEILISPKKFCADANAAQEELNRLGLNALNQGKDVVRLKQDLINDGKYPAECPCVVIERASCKDQNIIRGTVGTIAEILEQVGHKPPGALVIGDAEENFDNSFSPLVDAYDFMRASSSGLK